MMSLTLNSGIILHNKLPSAGVPCDGGAVLAQRLEEGHLINVLQGATALKWSGKRGLPTAFN